MHSDNKVVSLFSGAGGFSFGFSAAGLKPAFGAELSSDACETYERNVGSPCNNVDLSTIDPRLLKSELGGAQAFAIIGGPPCQGFSTAGTRNAFDTRNKLIFNYLHIVAELQPRWFVFENVEGLLTSNKGQSLASLIREFLKLGYSVRVQKVNFAGYGVPQTRKRVLIIGNRLGIDFEFPQERFSYDSGKSKKSNGLPFAPTLAEAIAGLGKATRTRTERSQYAELFAVNSYDERMRAGNSTGSVSEHFDRSVKGDIARYSMLRPGQTMRDLPDELQHESFKRRANRRVMDGMPTEKRGGAPAGLKRLHADLQCLTITGAATREFIHPNADRPLTIRECARIQSFPDSYQFFGGTQSAMQQIGNAVPPLAAQVIAEHIMKLDGKLGSGVPNKRNAARLLGFVLTDSFGKSDALKSTEALLYGLTSEKANA